jgi:hypothetical protein
MSAFPEAGQFSTLQEEFILLLEREHFLETCCGLAQTLDAPENKTFVLLLLDTFSFLFQAHWSADASDLLRAKQGADDRAARTTALSGAKPGAVGPKAHLKPSALKSIDDPLVAARKREAQQRAQTAVLSARHSRFGSQFALKSVAGRCAFLLAPLCRTTHTPALGCTTCRRAAPVTVHRVFSCVPGSEKLFSNLFQRPAQQMPQVAARAPRKGRTNKAQPVEAMPVVSAEAARVFDPMSSSLANKVL